MNQFFQKPWVRWLLVLLGLLILGTVVVRVLNARGLSTASSIVGVVTIVLLWFWGYYGLWHRRDRPWAKWGVFYLTASIVLWLITWYFYGAGYPQYGLRMLGLWAISAITLGGVHLARLTVSFSHPIFAVARTVLDQANRMHMVKVTALIVVLIVILLPLFPDPNDRLDYRITFYLTWSLNICGFFLGIMAVLLGCWTVSTDLSKRHIFMLASKPVNRFSYIAGKGIGLLLLNAVLLTVVGLGVWFGAAVMYAEPVKSEAGLTHREVARRDILSARGMTLPQFHEDIDRAGLIRNHFERLKSEVPDPTALPEKPEDMSNDLLMQINGRIVAEWHKLNPRETKRYVFHGLEGIVEEYRPYVDAVRQKRKRLDELVAANRMEEAKAVFDDLNSMEFPATSLRLRIKPKYSMNAPDNLVRLVIKIGGANPVALEPIPNDTLRDLPLDRYLGFIDEQGRLEVQIKHLDARNPDKTFEGAITFKPEEGLALFYTAGTFEGNILRAMIIFWIRLAFLSLLSVAASIFVSFPVAVLSGLVAYGIASASQFASESLDSYVALQLESPSKWDTIVGIISALFSSLFSGEFGVVVKLFLSLIGKTVLLIVPSFGQYSPTDRLANGLLVPSGLVADAFLFIFLISSGLCVLVGWIVFRRKELARVAV